MKMAETRPLNGTPGPASLEMVDVNFAKQMYPFQELKDFLNLPHADPWLIP